MRQLLSVAEVPVDATDAKAAVAEFIAFLGRNTKPQASSSLTANLIAQSDLTVLQNLAAAVPGATPGFYTGLSAEAAVTAGDFLAWSSTAQVRRPSKRAEPEDVVRWMFDKQAVKIAGFGGDLAPILSFSRALTLLEKLLGISSKASSATTWNLIARGVLWAGTERPVVAELALWDMNAFKRKKRFSLMASVLLPSDSGNAAADLAAVRALTGLKLPKPALQVRPDLGPPPVDGPDWLLIADVLHDEAILQATTTFQLSSLAHTLSVEESRAFRGSPLASGERINANRVFKSALGALPGYQRERPELNGPSFLKSISPEWNVRIAFEPINLHGANNSRRFNVVLTLVANGGPLDGRMWKGSIFNLLGYRDTPLSWKYDSELELVEALDGVVRLLEHVLPAYEAAVVEFLSPLPQEISERVPRLGPISARGAFEIACSLTTTSDLVSVSGLPRYVLHDRPGVDAAGLLMDAGTWQFTLSGDQCSNVVIPAIGTPQIRRLGDIALPRVGPDWIDSTEALALAKAQGGQEMLDRGASPPRPALTGRRAYGRPDEAQWEMLFVLGRELLRVYVSADGTQVQAVNR